MTWAEDYLRFRDQFAEAMNPRLYHIEYLDQRLAEGSAFLWANEDAAIVAEIKTFPTGAKAIHGLVAAGDLESIKELIARAESWGREQGCIGALIDSREGWAKALKSEGFAPFQLSIWKDL